MTALKTDYQDLKSAPIEGASVMIRVDWNVPVDHVGNVIDDFRIRASLPTLQFVIKKQPARIILLTHFGHPVVRAGEGLARTIAGNRTLRLEKLAAYVQRLAQLDDQPLTLEEWSASPLPVYHLGANLFLMENLRFAPGELAGDDHFAQQLAGLGSVFIHEAFPEVHRSVASLTQLPRLLDRYAGLRLRAEIDHLDGLLQKPEKPFVVVLGGAKVFDKVVMIDALLKKVDAFLLGGVMANTFLAAQRVDLKKSVVEEDRQDVVKGLLNRAPQKFILPVDFVWERDRALDIGPQTIQLFIRQLAKANTIFWNGPLGWTDAGRERFLHGSEAIARALGASAAKTIVAGGDTLAVVDRYHLGRQMTFQSTGGGATLAFLAGEILSGFGNYQPGTRERGF